MESPSGRRRARSPSFFLWAACRARLGPTRTAPKRKTERPPAGATSTWATACRRTPSRKLALKAGTQPGSSPIRRLTRTEYNNTVTIFFGDTTAPATEFIHAPEEVGLGFTNNAGVQTVSDLLAEQFESAASSRHRAATQDLAKLLSCDRRRCRPDRGRLRAHLPAWFGLKAFRRPLEIQPKSIGSLRSTLRTTKKTYDFATAVSSHGASDAAVAPLPLPRGDGNSVAGTTTTCPVSRPLHAFRTSWAHDARRGALCRSRVGRTRHRRHRRSGAAHAEDPPRPSSRLAPFFAMARSRQARHRREGRAPLPKLTTDVRSLLRTETELFVDRRRLRWRRRPGLRSSPATTRS